jgi:ABC-2 type transport system ATP-binding protein
MSAVALPDTAQHANAAALTRTHVPAIDVHGVHYRYAHHPVDAVAGISLRLAPGRIAALLGPNGAGKSTTIDMLAGFRTPSRGTVRVLGLNPSDPQERKELRTRMSVVLQHGAHLRYLTVRETLAMHASWHRAPRKITDVMRELDLEPVAHRRVRQLSGGEQRKLDVAVALVGNPELVLLDEPTTGFDPVARQRMWGTIQALADSGCAVLLTTHYMEEAQALSDHVTIIRSGAVVGAGTRDELTQILQLAPTISCTIPQAIDVTELPDVVRSAHPQLREHDGTTRVVIQTDDVVQVVAALTTWSVASTVALHDLNVTAPTIDDAYRALISDDAGSAQ